MFKSIVRAQQIISLHKQKKNTIEFNLVVGGNGGRRRKTNKKHYKKTKNNKKQTIFIS